MLVLVCVLVGRIVVVVLILWICVIYVFMLVFRKGIKLILLSSIIFFEWNVVGYISGLFLFLVIEEIIVLVFIDVEFCWVY